MINRYDFTEQSEHISIEEYGEFIYYKDHVDECYKLEHEIRVLKERLAIINSASFSGEKC